MVVGCYPLSLALSRGRHDTLPAMAASTSLAGLDELAGVTHLPSGKVRERYLLDDHRLLLVATDRISAFDVVLPTPIPDRGKVLTAMTAYWLRGPLAGEMPDHLISTDPRDEPRLAPYADALAGRSMVCRRAEMVPVECVARGWLAGSAWADYQATGSVCGVTLPDGLRLGDELPRPIFTPATKAEGGAHDENITFDDVVAELGGELAEELRAITLRLYSLAAAHAAERGLLLADTKFELGWINRELALCDEVLTCDSSRYWPAEDHQPGQAPPSYDKQVVRDWLAATDWDKTPPGPELPADVVATTRQRYIEVCERLTQRGLADWDPAAGDPAGGAGGAGAGRGGA